MRQEFQDFGRPDFFEAEAQGQPGNRRFRLIAGKGMRTASLWLEKDDVQALAIAMQQILTELNQSDVLRVEGEALAPPPQPRGDFPTDPDVEFQVGRWAIGFDAEQDRIVFLAAAVDVGVLEIPSEEDEIVPDFRAHLTREEAETFAEAAAALVAAGRPNCPLCGRSLAYAGEPHGCIKQNGHRHIEA